MNFARRFCTLFTQIFTITVKLRIFAATLLLTVFSDGFPNTVMWIWLKLAQISLKKNWYESFWAIYSNVTATRPKKIVSFFYCHKKTTRRNINCFGVFPIYWHRQKQNGLWVMCMFLIHYEFQFCESRFFLRSTIHVNSIRRHCVFFLLYCRSITTNFTINPKSCLCFACSCHVNIYCYLKVCLTGIFILLCAWLFLGRICYFYVNIRQINAILSNTYTH